MPPSYGYQYETSPRKIRPEYSKRAHKTVNKRQSKVASKAKKSKNSKDGLSQKINANQVGMTKDKIFIVFKCLILLAIIFILLFKSSQISQSFSKIQKLKADITSIEKENSQLEINIQNSLNLNNIEQAAKELLGMQRRTNKQTVYINIPKKDYVEPRVEEIIIEEEKGWFENLKEKIKNVF